MPNGLYHPYLLAVWHESNNKQQNHRLSTGGGSVDFCCYRFCGGCVFGLSVLSSFAIILMRKRELVGLLKLYF